MIIIFEVYLDFLQEVDKFCEGVRIAIGKEDFVVRARFGSVELKCKGKLVEVAD